jgi:tRNA A-37 threonylcarbamoyl transferase component Bud32
MGERTDRRRRQKNLFTKKWQRNKMSRADLKFLLNTKFLRSIPEESIGPLLDNLTFRHFSAGERFITQGDEGESLYIIRRGSCVINLEKDNMLHPMARLREGDIVGEMAVLTGERRSSHVDAESDIDLWSLGRAHFDNLSREYPDLRIFLTEIVTDRLSSSKLTAFRTVGKYVIRDVMGQGAWSVVYKGVHAKLNFPVAIKMMKHNMAMDEEFLRKFQNEAAIIARLNHPNIVKVYDIEELYRTVFIIMEYLEGYSLGYLLEHMPRRPLAQILGVLLQICSGLEYAHKKGIIHQDIKPENVFIQPDGQARIVDFGLATPAGSMDMDLPGTIFYMAPEQIQGEPVDERTDIYSLGITAYEMVTGKRPFPEDDLGKLMDYHIREDAPDPRLLVPDLPDELANFILRSTRKNPEERPRTVTEGVEQLRPLTEKLGIKFHARERKRGKMMGLFLFYQDEHQLALNRLIDNFTGEIDKIGATVRLTHLDNI